MSRRSKKISLVVLAAVLAVLVSIPLWLGLALRPILRSKHIVFERYERIGYAHFRLHHVTYQAARVTVTAGQVQTVTPVIWLAVTVTRAAW